MKVRIKQGEEMIDATIEIVDGVMVVSPKEVKFVPKDGDILSCFFRDEYQGTFVFEEASECGEAIFHFAVDADGKFLTGNGCAYFGYVYNSRPATEEEKKKLFDKIAEEGLTWDAEKKEIVKLKWKPKEGEIFHFPIFSDELGEFVTDYQENNGTIFMSIERDWCFKTEQGCREFCNRLNDAISQVKP